MAVLTENTPVVSALVCTRNRAHNLVDAVKSILHPNSMCCELIVIDQSSDHRSHEALQPYLFDSRLRYVQSDSVGKGTALNLGIELARGEFVAITDDDCEVNVTWPQYHVEAFVKHPQVAITYGNVVAGSHDPEKGFIPEYHISRDRLSRNILEKLPARGIGANTAIRRSAILALGGFDPEVGPGGLFRACIDRDMTIRCILAGYHVFESCKSTVFHYGFRTWDDGRDLTYNAWYGIGASCIKPLRCGRWDALPVGVYEFTKFALMPFLGAAIRGRKRAGWLRIRGFFDGLHAGCKHPLDREKLKYLSNSRPSENENDVTRQVA